MKPAFAAMALLAIATQVFAAAPPSDGKAIAVDAMTGIFKTKAAGAVDRYFAEPYVQHNLRIQDGLPPLRVVAQRAAEDPMVDTTIYRAIADGDLVALHSVYDGLARFDRKPMVAFDLFRIKDGKIVEHWDALTPLVGPRTAERSQVSGAVPKSAPAHTAASRALITSFVEKVRLPSGKGRWDGFLAPGYVEHALAPMQSGSAPKLTQLHRVLADGDFVLTQSAGTSNGQPGAVYDLYRLHEGKIAEHWEVVDIFIPKPQWQHSNGPF